MFDPKRLHTVKIKWSYPREYDNEFTGFENHDFAKKKGIYCISRKWGENNEKIIYIGKTTRSFRSRIKEHLKKDHSEWTGARGRFVIRLGVLDEETLSGFDDFKNIVEDIESCLIFEEKPCCNAKKKNGYKYTYDLRIKNVGFPGKLTREICNREH